MSTIWPEVADHILLTSSWITLADHVYLVHGATQLALCTDEQWVIKVINDYNGKQRDDGYYRFQKIIHKPTPRLSSASSLRDAVKNNDPAAFSQAAGVPSNTPIDGQPFFQLVKSYLDKYTEQPAKARKKAVSENSRWTRR